MEGISIQIHIIAGIVVVGALVESFFPGLITEKLKGDLTALTIATIGILLSFVLLMLLLKLRIREGFENNEAMTAWKQAVEYYKIEEICKIYPDIYAKILTLQKGPPPSTVTDAQAREQTDEIFQKEMSTKLFSCKQFVAVQNATSLNPFFEALYELDTEFFAQAYDTILASRTLLIRQYNEVQAAKQRRTEGFEDQPVCEGDVKQERRKMIKDKYLEAQKYMCKLPEEVPDDKKEEFAKKKIAYMSAYVETYKQKYNVKDSIDKIIDDCNYYMAKLEEDKKAAENGTIGMPPKPAVPKIGF